MFCSNPVDTRCRFNAYSTSVLMLMDVDRCWNDVVCLQGNILYPANLYDLNSDKHKISYSPFVNFVALQA